MTSTIPDEVTSHDVVVVGARCAGSATALLLARAGHDVLLVDKARLPSDRLSTHAIARGGVVQLRRWGLLDAVLETGAPPIRRVAFHLDGEVKRHTVKPTAGVDMLLAPRRIHLDGVLADAAVRAGAELCTGRTVLAVVRDPHGRVVGVRARTPDGAVHEHRARLVIGADGMHSRMAALLGAARQEWHAPGETTYYGYVSGVDWQGFEFHVASAAFAGMFTTHHGHGCVWLSRPSALLADVATAGAERPGAWQRALDASVPDLGERVRAGALTEPVRGATRLPQHLRVPVGPGWALVGDAAYHKDPITGHGITDAFRDADLLATAADDALRHPHREAAALLGYHRQRDRLSRDVFELTRAIAGFPEPQALMALQIRLSGALEEEALTLAARAAPRWAADASAA